MKVILSIMAEYQHENFALERWRSKFATEMINVDNCLDVIVFLDDCHRNVGFVQDLKKLGSFYLINLILAIVAMSYDELQRQAEEEAQR